MTDPVPLFGLGRDETANANLPWAFEAWEAYISGYRDAARCLVKDLSSLVPEWAFYPIAFLYRHCVELQLKSLILNGHKLLQEEVTSPFGHDLKRLWTQARAVIVRAGFDAGSDSLMRTDRTIQDLTEADPSGQSFRYPLDPKGQPNLAMIAGVNIRDFATQMDRLVDFLVGLNEALHIQMQTDEEEEDAAIWLSGY